MWDGGGDLGIYFGEMQGEQEVGHGMAGCGEKDFGRGWERNRVDKKAGEREEEAGECGNECEKEMRILERVRRKRRLGER